MILSPVLRQRYFDSNGNPLAGGKLYSYVAGTTTPQATYTDQAGLSANANPVVLDANGEAAVWIDSTLAYKFILKDASDVTQWTTDQVADPNAAELPGWNVNATYSAGSIVSDSSGYGLLYVSLVSANVGNALTDVSKWRVFDGNVRTVTANTALAVTDNIVRSDSTSGSLTQTLPVCSTTPIGKEITVKDVGTGGFTTSVRGNGTDTVDGVVTFATALRVGESLRFKNKGTRWDVIASHLPLTDGDVTQVKLAARATGTTVAAGGIAKSTSSGTFTSSSASFVDVTNLAVTITTTGRPVMLMLQADTTNSYANGNYIQAGTGDLSIKLLRGATDLGTFGFFTGVSTPTPPVYIDIVAAGTYTYKVQTKTSGGTSAFTGMVLVAYEI